MKKKVLICLLIIVLILAVLASVFVFKTVKKMKIVEDLESKMEQYVGNRNYYLKTTSYNGDKMSVLETFVKDDKMLSKMTTEGETIYSDEENSFQNLPVWEYYLFADNRGWDLFWSIAFCPVEEVEVNGIECQRIDNYHGGLAMEPAEGEYYYCIAKDTGLLTKLMLGDAREPDGTRVPVYNEYEVKFDCVTEEDFVKSENLE